MLTRRQKNSIRGFTAVMSCSALLAGFLIYTNIMNTSNPEPVVISDILEGAVAYAGENEEDAPQITLASDELMETMFAAADAPAPTFNTQIPEVTESFIRVTEAPPETTLPSTAPDTVPYETIGNLNEVTLLSEELESLRTGDSALQPAETSTPEMTADTTLTTQTYYITGSSTPRSSVTKITPATTVTTWERTTTTPMTTSVPPTQTTTTKATTTTAKTTAATTKTTTAAKTTAPAAKTSGTSKTPFINVGGGTFSTDDSIYLKLFELVNEAREKAGVGKLWYSARVHDVCKIRADEISSYYSHTRPDGSRFSTAFRDVGIVYKKCGENIAYGLNMFDTPEEVFQAWMDSESHRENILSPDYECCAFGLSVLKIGNDTYYYWAQEFAKL